MPDIQKLILIVDDDDYNLDFYQELLQDAGYKVDTAPNGSEGMKKLDEIAHYDLILLDIVMPVKDGMETLKALQGNPVRAKHGPIFMLSALGQDSVLDNAKALGCNGYIVKTDITPEDLLAKVKEILQ
ncbi:MAG TPA: response regulator [Patescibacteria group bacterium]|nr:response regulator [Patescibacteria group bacterium]